MGRLFATAEGERSREDVAWDTLGLVLAYLAFLLVGGLLLWPVGKLGLLWPLSQGLAVFLLATMLVNLVTSVLSSLFRLSVYHRSGWFVGLGLMASGVLMLGWTMYALSLLDPTQAGNGGWKILALFLVGLLSVVPASQAVGLFYHGQIYRLASLALGLLGCLGWLVSVL